MEATIIELFEKYFHTRIYLQLLNLPYEQRSENSYFLRQEMDNYLKKTFHHSDELLLDIVNVPQAVMLGNNKKYASISHSEKQGVFVISDFPIGVDIETLARIHYPIIKRISTPDEINLTTTPAIIWSIKEACFKAIPYLSQPKVISEIEILKIESLDSVKAKASIAGFFPKKFQARIKSQEDMSILGVAVNNESIQLCAAIILKQ